MIPFDQDPFQVSLQEDALQSKLSDLGIQKRLVAKTFKWTYFMQSLGNGLKSLAPKVNVSPKTILLQQWEEEMFPYRDNILIEKECSKLSVPCS